jgi:hypothetical protein
MATLLVFEFPFSGPWGDEMAAALHGLALDIAGEPGLISKLWTEAPERGVAGGVYLFETEAAASAYTAKHSARLAQFGIAGIDVRSFAVNDALSAVTRGR